MLDWLVLAGRLLLVVVMATAGAAKLADLDGSRRAVADFGVPERLAPIVGVLLPLAELAIAIFLIPVATAPVAAIAAAALLLAFSAAIANAIVHGREPDCHCFGQIHSEPAGWRTLARNLVLLAVALFVAIAGASNPGKSATHWLTTVSAAAILGIVAGLLAVVLLGFVVWFALQLLAQNGRIAQRLEALEQAVNALAGGGVAGGAAGAGAGEAQLGAGLGDMGLPVGAPAPAFELPDVAGTAHTLESLLAGGRPLLLIFSDAGCGPCAALMPQVAVWQAVHAERLTIAVIAAGDPEQNRAKAREHGIERMLLQPETQVSDAYRSPATPSAVIVSAGGRIESPLAGGADAIQTLVARAAARGLAIVHVGGPGGSNPTPGGSVPEPGGSALPVGDAAPNESDPALSEPEIAPINFEPITPFEPAPLAPPAVPPSSAVAEAAPARVGDPAPELELSSLDGSRVALADLYERPTLALFWNPGCGFCQRMLPDLLRFEREADPNSSPQIVVFTTGDAELNRAEGLRSLMLLDGDGAAQRAFGAAGTPMAVMIESGRIASPVAAGADAVFALATGGR